VCGLAANPVLPPELVDQLTAGADDDIAGCLACRADLTRAQALALAGRVPGSAAWLAHQGRFTARDIDPSAWPDAALVLLDQGAGRPEWARLLAADPVRERREKLAACPGLPSEVVTALAADPDVQVVAELALWTTSDVAVTLAAHPHAEVRRAVACNEATPPATLSALVTGEGGAEPAAAGPARRRRAEDLPAERPGLAALGLRGGGRPAHRRRPGHPAGLHWIASFAQGIGPTTDLVVPRDAAGRLLAPTSLVKDAHKEALVLHPSTARNENRFLPADFQVGTDPNAYGNPIAAFRTWFATGLDGLFTDNADTAALAREDYWNA
jgi:hypothetical protein